MGGPQPALMGVRGPQAIQSWRGHTCGRHMSSPPGKHRGEEVWEEGEEGRSKRDEERGKRDEEELRRRKEEGDSATLHQYAQGLYFVQK